MSLVERLYIRNKEREQGVSSNIVTGLVVQGGGMRGIYSMAVLSALHELGLGNAFDHVFGSSAGAINGAYMLTGQAKLAVTVYLDDISNRKFVDLLRFSKMVDIDFLVDSVLSRKKRIDVEALNMSSSKLHFILTDAFTGKPEVMTYGKKYDLNELFRATAAMPILYNKKVSINGRHYVDGGIAALVPLFQAIEYGCTDILIVITKNIKYRKKRPMPLSKIIRRLFIRNFPETLKRILLKEDSLFNNTMDFIENHKNNGSINLKIIYPENHNLVKAVTTDRKKLLRFAHMGVNDLRTEFGEKPLFENPFG